MATSRRMTGTGPQRLGPGKTLDWRIVSTADLL